MEGTRRERLTGAIIFFAVLAIAAPELFDGPGDGARTREDMPADIGPPVATYDLAISPAATAGADDAQRATLAVNPEQSEAIAQAVPPPVTEAPTPPSVAASGTPDVAVTPPQTTASVPSDASVGAGSGTATATAPATAPAPAPETGRTAAAPSAPAAKPATGTAGGGWWVQLGSFASSENAQRLARDLRAKGFSVEVSKGRSGGRELNLVRSGPVNDRAAATVLQGRLAAAGSPGGMLVPPP